MITMDVKGITWVENIYQKFENMCLEAEDMICEDAVKYIENQMQTVGASVKKLYSDIIQDFIPPSSCDLDVKVASELPVDQYTDAGFFEKPFQVFKEKPVKEGTRQTNNDSRIAHGVDNDESDDGTSQTDALFMSSSRSSVKGSNFISHSRHSVETMDIKPNLGIDENQANKRAAANRKFDEITVAETNACRTLQSRELSNENQNHAVGDSKPASAEVTRLASLANCYNKIENAASTEQFPNFPVFPKSAEEKEVKTSSSDVLFGAPDGHKTMQLKLEETCVMVTGDELKLVPKAGGNINKKKRRQAFLLSKKSARKQEYEELAVWHGNSEKLMGDCVGNLDPASLEDQKKLLLPSMSEPEWELL